MYEVEQLVGAEWRPGGGDEVIVRDPADDTPVSRVRATTGDDVTTAVATARAAAAD